jgi:hypothetical protein
VESLEYCSSDDEHGITPCQNDQAIGDQDMIVAQDGSALRFEAHVEAVGCWGGLVNGSVPNVNRRPILCHYVTANESFFFMM